MRASSGRRLSGIDPVDEVVGLISFKCLDNPDFFSRPHKDALVNGDALVLIAGITILQSGAAIEPPLYNYCVRVSSTHITRVRAIVGIKV